RDRLRKHSDKRDGQQETGEPAAQACHDARLPHAAAAQSEIRFPHCVTTTIRNVRFTSSGRSRASAALHASCPTPGRSQMTSMGMHALKAMLVDTPVSAST